MTPRDKKGTISRDSGGIMEKPVNSTIAAIAVAGIAALPPTILATATLVVSLRAEKKVEATVIQSEKNSDSLKDIQHQTNSMKDALVAAAKKQGKVEGKEEGISRGVAKEKARAEASKVDQATGAAAEKARPFWKK